MKYLIPLTIFSFLLFGCIQQHTIFYQIDQETKLEDAVIAGSVTSVVKFNSKLYACDGNIYSKDENAVRGWSKISGPDGNIIKLAADTNNLYALNSDKKLYTMSKDAASWSEVTTTKVGTVEIIFDNGNDKAYLKGSSGYFELNNSSDPQSTAAVSSIVILKTDSNWEYTASGGTVSSKNGTLGTVSGLGEVYSLTYSKADSAIYAGTSKGLRKLPVDTSGKLTGANEDPPGNWVSTIKTYEAFDVLATGDNGNTALYSSTIAQGSANVKVNGLWGYYYGRRSNWNRE